MACSIFVWIKVIFLGVINFKVYLLKQVKACILFLAFLKIVPSFRKPLII